MSDAQSGNSETAQRKANKRKRIPSKLASRKKQKPSSSGAAQIYRTSSQVPSDEDEDEDEEEKMISKFANVIASEDEEKEEEAEEAEEAEDEVLEFDLNSANTEEEEEEEMPKSIAPRISSEQATKKKKRLGLGHLEPSGKKKIFDLTN